MDLTGMKFGRLTVMCKVSEIKPIMWECICECGKTKIASGKSLKSGDIVSCGCKNEEIRQQFKEKFRQSGTNNPQTIQIEIDGFSRSVEEWSYISGIKASTIRNRLNRGWKTEDLLNPIDKSKRRKDLNVDEY